MRVFDVLVCVRSAGRGLFTVRNTDFNFNEAGGGPNEPQLVMTKLATHLFMYVCMYACICMRPVSLTLECSTNNRVVGPKH